jgi:hypothetical protein
MDYENAILEALEFPCPGMTFNELYSYLQRHGYESLTKKTLSKRLKRLKAQRLITTAFHFYPNGQIAKIYTHPLNLQFGYLITENDLKRLLMRKY